MLNARKPQEAPPQAAQAQAAQAKVVPLRPRAERRNRDELAFLPAALEVVETPASPALRLTAITLCLIIAGALAWSIVARIDMVAVAQGKIVPVGQVKVVQPLETAAIRAIHVDDGDHVKAGELLVDLDPTDLHADLKSLLYNRGQAALDAEVGHLLLSRDPNGPFAAPDGVDPTLTEANRAQAVSEIAKHLAELLSLRSDIEQHKAELEAATVQVEKARQTLPLLQEKHANLDELWQKRVGPRQPVLDAQQLIIEKQAEIKSGEAASRQARAQIASLESKITQTTAGFLADAADRRTKALQKLADLDQQIAKTQQRVSYRRLVAPVDGTVQNVKVHTPGAVVTTADVLMTVVPDGAGIEVEAMVQNQDIGFVHEGQEVEVKLDAFPFTRYGLVKGVVRKLGRDAVPPTPGTQGPSSSTQASQANAAQNTPPPDLAYPAKITLARDVIEIESGPQKLAPGMHVSAEIKTGDRRAIDYLLSPIMQRVKEAARER
jgi:hemolysin D